MTMYAEQYRHQSPEGVNGSEMPRLRALAEPCVWTDRMLTALETGVKGGKWHSLIDKVWQPENLYASFARVSRNNGAPGVDGVTCEHFAAHLDQHVSWLRDQLQSSQYQPQCIRRTWIEKTGRKEMRPLGIPTIRDRTIQGALLNVLEPIFERDFSDHSYGFRPGRGCKDALRRVTGLLRDGYVWVLDADLKSYFDTIPHDQLLALVAEKVSDRRILALIAAYLAQPILDDCRYWTPETGTPQGAVLSPLLANIYLDPLDHQMEEAGFEMVRYADDFVILCRSEAAVTEALTIVRRWTEGAGLTLHPDKTRVVDARQSGGFDFLGYHFERGKKWPTRKAEKRLRDTIREKTRRANGNSLSTIIARINPVLRGWFEYFKHGRPHGLRRLDSWIRMRLRSILRKRHKGQGRGRGLDHFRWPNAFFGKLGLYSLATAWDTARQSVPR